MTESMLKDIAALNAAVAIANITMHGMISENEYRKLREETPAYNYEAFFFLKESLVPLFKKFCDEYNALNEDKQESKEG